MYSRLITRHILVFFLTFIILLAVPFLLHFVFQVPIFPEDNGQSSDQDVARWTLVVGYIILVFWYEFFIYLTSISVPPLPETKLKAQTKQKLLENLRTLFSSVKANDSSMFELSEKPDSLTVQWDQKINFKQLLSLNTNGVNYRVTFKLIERKKRVLLHSSVTETRALAGIGGLKLGFNYSGGIVYQAGIKVVPSFEKKDGRIVMDVKKLTYNNATIIDPAIELFRQAGWETRFTMFKHPVSRSIYRVSGWLIGSFGCLLFLTGLLWTFGI